MTPSLNNNPPPDPCIVSSYMDGPVTGLQWTEIRRIFFGLLQVNIYLVMNLWWDSDDQATQLDREKK